jgi:GT2 family glycosyltransferase
LPPELSIVIPCHNRADLLRACLASVIQHAPANCEIIVVDDASPGASASAVANEFGYPRVLCLSQRHGFCAAVNAGIDAARTPIVELLNDDTEVTTGWAEPALAQFRDPTVGAVAPLVLCWPGGVAGNARIDSAGDRYYRGGVAGKRARGEVLGPGHLKACRVFGASASSAFYRREALLRAGGLPKSFGAYFEDVDLSFRLHRAGYHIVYEPASRVLHHVSASHGRADRRLLEQQSRNEERVFWRNLPAAALATALPAHLAVLAAKALRRWREGTLLPFLRGRFSVLKEVSDLIRQRRDIANLGPATAPESWLVEKRLWQ